MEKKKMKLWKKILLVFIIIFVLFAIHTIRNYIILTKLVNNGKEIANSTNYYAEVTGIQDDKTVNMTKCYKNGNEYLTVVGQDIYNQDKRKMEIYANEDEKFAVLSSEEGKILLKDNIVLEDIQPANISKHIYDKMFALQISAIAKIRKEKCHDKECYLVELDKNWKMWVEIDTGLIVREINGAETAERKYEFDVIKDGDIVKPDTTNCIVSN